MKESEMVRGGARKKLSEKTGEGDSEEEVVRSG